MHESLIQPLQALLNRENLSADDVTTCIGAIMDGLCDPVDIAAFLTAMAAKGPISDELVGAARAMRQRVTQIVSRRSPLLDTCGTGGDRLHTFNISTATAVVAAACGVNVAKHGNRSVSSSSGSADVLEALDVNINLTADQARQCLDAIGIAFCFAPMLHGAMKYAAPVRRQLGFPTIFNLLGPLTNPAGAQYQLIGASSAGRAKLLAEAIRHLNIERALVVCGNDQLDEVCLWGTTTVFEVTRDAICCTEWTPETFGLARCDVAELTVDSAMESAAVIRQIFEGQSSAPANMVIANTAAALVACGHCKDPREASEVATGALQTGAALAKLNELTHFSQSLRT